MRLSGILTAHDSSGVGVGECVSKNAVIKVAFQEESENSKIIIKVFSFVKMFRIGYNVFSYWSGWPEYRVYFRNIEYICLSLYFVSNDFIIGSASTHCVSFFTIISLGNILR